MGKGGNSNYLRFVGLTNHDSEDYGAIVSHKPKKYSGFCKSDECCSIFSFEQVFNKKKGKAVLEMKRITKSRVNKVYRTSDRSIDSCKECGSVIHWASEGDNQ